MTRAACRMATVVGFLVLGLIAYNVAAVGCCAVRNRL
jgi:hypothetical protein